METGVAGSEPRRSPARERLLAVASALFYREGISSVGVDRIVTEAGVTRSTMYRHFSGKEDLVEAYLLHEDETIRGFFSGAEADVSSPTHRLELIVAMIAQDVAHNHTRGCPFINAAAEYPDPESRIRKSITAHRAWFRNTLQAALEEAGRSEPELRAQELVLLRDAALVGGYLDGVESTSKVFRRAARVAVDLP